jgi:hypothetical protein
VLPVITALRAHPDRERLVAEPLRKKYFEEHLLVSGWYPERDYFALVEALVKTIDPAVSGGDVWRFFARFSVQRDLAGIDVTGRTTEEARGVYRNFAQVPDGEPEHLFRRAAKLWGQYHDSGSMQICGGRVGTNAVVMQLIGFHIPIDGFVRLQGHYLEEFGRLVGVEMESKVTRSTARGSMFCEWEYRLARTPTTEAYVASLPAVR